MHLGYVFQRNAFANDLIPVENYMDAIQMSHFTTLSSMSTSCVLLMFIEFLQPMKNVNKLMDE